MAITKVTRELLSTGIDDNSNATAITIDSSENSTFAGNIVKGNLTISGTEIDLSSGSLTIDVAGNITLDADDAGEVRFKDGGTHYGTIKKDGNNTLIQSIVADGDLVFQGIDGSSFVTSMYMDMSAGGNVGIGAAPTLGALHVTSATNDIVTFENTSSGTTGAQLALFHNSSSPADGDRVGALTFQGDDDGGNHTTYAGIRGFATDVSDGSEDGNMTFHATVGGTFSEVMRIDSMGVHASLPAQTGIGKFGGTSANAVSLGDDGLLDISQGGTCGAWIVHVYERGSGAGAYYWCDYDGTTKLKDQEPAGGAGFAASDADGYYCLYKGDNSHTVYFKNRNGSTRSFMITIFGAEV